MPTTDPTAAAQAAPEPKTKGKKFKVIDRLKHGGQLYGPAIKGKDTIALGAEEAQALIEAGVIAAPNGDAAETPAT